MATKSKKLRKLEIEVRRGHKELRPDLRSRLRHMERSVRELRKQIKRFQNIRYHIKRTQIPLLEDLKLSEALIATIKGLDKEMAEAARSKNREREKELNRRFRRRDADADRLLGQLDRRVRKVEEIEKRWNEIQKDLKKLIDSR